MKHAVPLRVDTVAPVLRAISFRRLIFRTSEAARVTLVVDGHTYLRNVRAGVFSFHLGTLARRIVLSGEDAAGNVSRSLHFP